MYDDNFYSVIDEGCRRSAAALVPRLLDLFPGTLSVIDVGCGRGHWGKAFEDNGCPNAIGIDGSYVGDPLIPFVPHDLTTPLPMTIGSAAKFDMAICLEVAEHLPPERADTFIDDLCALSDVVIFSAAIPGQGGTGHINCQWQSWWARKFWERGYDVDGSQRFRIWDDDRIENWYRQNLLVCARGRSGNGTGSWDDYVKKWGPFDVVHPVLYDYVRGAR